MRLRRTLNSKNILSYGLGDYTRIQVFVSTENLKESFYKNCPQQGRSAFKVTSCDLEKAKLCQYFHGGGVNL